MSKKKEYSFAESLEAVHKKYLEETLIVSRVYECGRQLYLTLNEVFELIKLNELPPDDFSLISIEEAVAQWDHWQIPPDNNGKLSIQELFNRASPKNEGTTFLAYCKANKVVPLLSSGDVYFNSKFSDSSAGKIKKIIEASKILSKYLLPEVKDAV